MKIFYNSRIVKWFFPKWVDAFTIGSWIFTEYTEENIPAWTLPHEKVHVKQYKEYGIIKFLWIYVWKERHLPYREKTFEIEAYKISDPIRYSQ